MKMKRSTPNYMVYGESGCMPLSVDIQEKTIYFWAQLHYKVETETTEKLSKVIYRSINKMSTDLDSETLKKKCPWLYNIRSVLINCGHINIWENQTTVNTKWLKLSVRQKLQDLFLTEWYSLTENASTCYRIFKKSFGFENYLKSTPCSLSTYFTKFRTRNHRLPIETGNWNRVPRNIRFCNHCVNKIGDEFHYLFECVFF